MTSKHWFDPENLAKTEKGFRERSPVGLKAQGDFGGYAEANRGAGVPEEVKAHNLLDPDVRTRIYRALLRREEFKQVADIGCGLGHTAAALSQNFHTSSVTGLDISTDACEWAQRQWPALKFIAQAISSEGLGGRYFDFIVCQEFYPFTRTNDWEFQNGMIDGLVKALAPHGLLLIVLTERNAASTILANSLRLQVYCDKHALSYSYVRLPFDKVFRYFPVYRVASWISDLLSKALRKPQNIALLLRAG